RRHRAVRLTHADSCQAWGLPPLCAISAADRPVQSVFRHLSLPQGCRLILGADLNRSELSRSLMLQSFSPESAPTRRFRDTLRNKRFSAASAPTATEHERVKHLRHADRLEGKAR